MTGAWLECFCSQPFHTPLVFCLSESHCAADSSLFSFFHLVLTIDFFSFHGSIWWWSSTHTCLCFYKAVIWVGYLRWWCHILKLHYLWKLYSAFFFFFFTKRKLVTQSKYSSSLSCSCSSAQLPVKFSATSVVPSHLHVVSGTLKSPRKIMSDAGFPGAVTVLYILVGSHLMAYKLMHDQVQFFYFDN